MPGAFRAAIAKTCLPGASHVCERAKEPPVRNDGREHKGSDLARQLLCAQEEERQRIAAELHDSIGQQLCAILFRLDSLRDGLDERLSDDERRRLQDLARLVSQTMDETRRISMGLRPPMLDDLGVSFAVDWFCNELTKVYSHVALRRDIHVDEDLVPPPVKVAIFRIVQEACNNACKHSGATAMAVRLCTGPKGIRLQVSDDGIGFDYSTATRTRHSCGLRGMHERALQSGGRLRLRTHPGSGTRVIAHWPLSGHSPEPREKTGAEAQAGRALLEG
jgi:hypothetical protein